MLSQGQRSPVSAVGKCLTATSQKASKESLATDFSCCLSSSISRSFRFGRNRFGFESGEFLLKEFTVLPKLHRCFGRFGFDFVKLDGSDFDGDDVGFEAFVHSDSFQKKWAERPCPARR